ncbi:MAG: ABC transporter substrate-binding protein [Alphaproteobacteria bacterium]|nr:ABC transporter substrate-binding protein [Alphaproteobacteria bacterium]
MNLCTDQLVLLLADPGQVVSVSYLSARPEDSLLATRTAGLVLNHGQTEEVLPLRPDLVVAGIYTTRFTVRILQRRNVPVLDLPPAENFDDVRANIRAVAAALGTEQRGEALIRRMDRRIAALASRVEGLERPRALIYRAGGFTLGRDTFAGELLDLAGYKNAATDYGVEGWGAVPVEAVLQLKPDLLVVGVYRDNAPSLARDVTEHPALRHRMPRIVSVPTRHWACGIPAALDIVEGLINRRLGPPGGTS